MYSRLKDEVNIDTFKQTDFETTFVQDSYRHDELEVNSELHFRTNGVSMEDFFGVY